MLEAYHRRAIRQTEGRSRLDGADIRSAAEQREIQRLAHLMGGSHVIHVAVRKDVALQWQPGNLAQDALCGVARRRVDEHIAHHVHVDLVSRATAQLPETSGHLLCARDVI